jgi:hypothetical protein
MFSERMINDWIANAGPTCSRPRKIKGQGKILLALPPNTNLVVTPFGQSRFLASSEADFGFPSTLLVT